MFDLHHENPYAIIGIKRTKRKEHESQRMEDYHYGVALEDVEEIPSYGRLGYGGLWHRLCGGERYRASIGAGHHQECQRFCG